MSERVHTLERLVWRKAGERLLNVPGADRVATFPDREPAEAACREAEWAVRRRINPFQCGGPFLHYQSSFDAARLYDWCLDAGLDPPGVTEESLPWNEWWDNELPRMRDVQIAAVWEALDRVRFYRVGEAEAGRPGNLVALPHCEDDPVEFSPPFLGSAGYVGCTPYMFTRSTPTADDLCHQIHLNQLARLGAYTSAAENVPSWVQPESDPWYDAEESPGTYALYAERRPIELVSVRPPRPGQDVFVVLRRSWRLVGLTIHWWRWSKTQADPCGWPVAAFDTLAAADALTARLEAEARLEAVSAFRFGPPHEWCSLHTTAIWGVLAELAPIAFTEPDENYEDPDRLWGRWWDAALPGLTAEQIETAWGLYDRLRFYEVVAVEYRE